MKNLPIRLCCLLIVMLFSAACDLPNPGGGGEAPPASEIGTGGAALTGTPDIVAVPGEVLIKFRPEVVQELPQQRQIADGGALSIQSAQVDPILSELDITSLEPMLEPVVAAAAAQNPQETYQSLSRNAGNTEQVFIAGFDPERNPQDVAAAIAEKTEVEYAEPNYVAFATSDPVEAPSNFVPNDPYYNTQWNLPLIQMEQAWNYSTGMNVLVAVLDTGIARGAPDLVGVDIRQGYNFINNTPDPVDDQGHGTHVSGTIAQATNNSEGVAGVAYKASLLPVKVLDSRGQGSYDAIIRGIIYAVESGAQVINLSLAGAAPSQSLREAIDLARSRGVVVVTAAGNNGGAVGYPARYESTIAVGAVRLDRQRTAYSNFGPEIDVVAPGGDNRSDQNGDGFGDGIVQQTISPDNPGEFRYLFFEGTSMAAPHVSGVAALLLSAQPGLGPDQVQQALQNTAIDLGTPGRDNEYGFGLIQAYDALAAVGVVPGTGPTPTSPPGPTPTPQGPTATPVPGVTPSPTPLPPTATPIPGTPSGELRNGGFESNDSWVFQPSPSRGQYTQARIRSGQRAAVVGVTGNNTYAYSSVIQRIAIPADIQSATLSAHLWPVAEGNAAGDHQLLLIRNPNNGRVEEIRKRAISTASTWQLENFDLTRYRGRTIEIYFGVFNDGQNGKAYMYIDDVSLSIVR